MDGTVGPAFFAPLALRDFLGVHCYYDNLFVGLHGDGIYPQLVSGEIIVGHPAVRAVEHLRVSEGLKHTRNVELTWRNRGLYDSIQVERNGVIIAELSGQVERMTDEIAGAGAYWYRVRGVAENVTSPWSLAIHTDLGAEPLFRRGDANADGRVNVADAVHICAQLFRGAPISCEDACDSNDDGRLNVADPVFLLGYVFLATEPPPSPGPRVKWYDTTPDGLRCEIGTP